MPKRIAVANGQAAITAYGGALYLFSPKDRNDIIRSAATNAGEMWRQKFLPPRFTKYVVRYPFNYGNKGPGFITAKVRKSKDPEIQKRWRGFVANVLHGWDPWSSTSEMPKALFSWWLREHPHEYKSRLGGGLQLNELKRLREDLRRWAKKTAKQFAALLDRQGFVLPLVDSGDLRRGAGGGQVIARSTAFNFSLRVTIPFPGPRNPVVPKILETVPPWEAERVGEYMAKQIASVIAGASETFTPSAGGGVNRGYRLEGAQSRIPDTAYGRSVG